MQEAILDAVEDELQRITQASVELGSKDLACVRLDRVSLRAEDEDRLPFFQEPACGRDREFTVIVRERISTFGGGRCLRFEVTGNDRLLLFEGHRKAGARSTAVARISRYASIAARCALFRPFYRVVGGVLSVVG
jgi:hypothetical protein